jgi:hypothetical protein
LQRIEPKQSGPATIEVIIMRRGHEHEQHHSGNGAAAAGGHGRPAAGLPTAQWQAPQRPNGYEHYCRHYEADLDQVESAFFEGFAEASDPVSFLKLAGIPFEAFDGAGQRLALLRVECGLGVDVGSLSPRAASEEMRYTPLPRRMVTRRRRVRFLYVDGVSLRSLTLGEVRALKPL